MSADLQDVVASLRQGGSVYAEEEADLLLEAATDDEHLGELVRRRNEGEPVEHLVGWVAFAGLRLAVTAGVFVPRRRTELLAREAACVCPAGGVLVELCCGCAPVSAAVVAADPSVAVVAADIDPAAVACAARNLPSDALTCCGDLFAPLPGRLKGRVDVLVANAPYVPTEAVAMMPREARLHEPLVALDGGPDGLEVHRRLLAEAGEWLTPEGQVLIEVAGEQVVAALAIFESHDLTAQVVGAPEIGGTVLVGNRARATRPGRFCDLTDG
jgi:release factor glutamine methyltransferase